VCMSPGMDPLCRSGHGKIPKKPWLTLLNQKAGISRGRLISGRLNGGKMMPEKFPEDPVWSTHCGAGYPYIAGIFPKSSAHRTPATPAVLLSPPQFVFCSPAGMNASTGCLVSHAVEVPR
jgi:hypothetical protein